MMEVYIVMYHGTDGRNNAFFVSFGDNTLIMSALRLLCEIDDGFKNSYTVADSKDSIYIVLRNGSYAEIKPARISRN